MSPALVTVTVSALDSPRSPEVDPAAIAWPPAHLESCEPPMESDLHLFQMLLLLQCLKWAWRDRRDFYTAGNLTIYYSPHQRKSEDFRGPDFFVVLGVEPTPRSSWVVWEEDGRYPNVIIELLSASTARIDRNEKKEIYQDIFRTPDYFWFDPQGGEELAGFHLVDGRYQAIAPNERGWLWSEQLQLYLGRHAGTLRFFTATGELLPTPEEEAQQAIQEAQQAIHAAEAAQQAALSEQQRAEIAQQQALTEQQRAEVEQQRAEAEQQRAEAEQQRAEAAERQLAAEQLQSQRLAAKLRELGIDPEALS